MKVEKQLDDYGCGAYCVHFILGLYKVSNILPEAIEEIMGTTPEKGTTHEGIKKGLKYFNFKWTEWSDSHVSAIPEFIPCIVNYQYCDKDGCDGHYVVIIGANDDDFIIYEPYKGEIETINIDEFDKLWYSERYGKKWFIHPTHVKT